MSILCCTWGTHWRMMANSSGMVVRGSMRISRQAGSFGSKKVNARGRSIREELDEKQKQERKEKVWRMQEHQTKEGLEKWSRGLQTGGTNKFLSPSSVCFLANAAALRKISFHWLTNFTPTTSRHHHTCSSESFREQQQIYESSKQLRWGHSYLLRLVWLKSTVTLVRTSASVQSNSTLLHFSLVVSFWSVQWGRQMIGLHVRKWRKICNFFCFGPESTKLEALLSKPHTLCMFKRQSRIIIQVNFQSELR